MRVRLPDKERSELFLGLGQRGMDLEHIAKSTGVNIRSVRDWKRGKYTIPLRHLKTVIELAGMEASELTAFVVNDWWYTKEAGRKGAFAQMAKHGPLGTPESRARGGNNSYAQRKHDTKDIFARTKIRIPGIDEKLAEFMGVMIGDGNITKYQTSIALSSAVDRQYASCVAELVATLFGIQPSIIKRKSSNCLVIVASSIELVNFLVQKGAPLGDKLRQNLDIPTWITVDKDLSAACLRGIFDTDGCVFHECHRINGKRYCYPRLSFVSMSPCLRASIYEILLGLGFMPKIRNNRSVNLESRADIAAYFELVGSSNPKHIHRWQTFGRVA